jgi:sulfite reductase (NADPH) hemoprotein beta-component
MSPALRSDPLYGKTYLPRKFKTGFAIPPNNDTDIFTNDMGFVAIVENGKLIGYNLLVGGGLGTSHGNKATYPRLADVIGFITREQLVEVGAAVVAIHRDWGDRTDRKHARIKYVLQEKGVEWFRAELGQRLGAPLPAAKAFLFRGQGDAFGWFKQLDGNWFLGLFVETGRVKDADRLQAEDRAPHDRREVRPDLPPHRHAEPHPLRHQGSRQGRHREAAA